MPAATASRPRTSGLMPTGGGGTATVCGGGGGGGAASTTRSTQPPGPCAVAAAAAAPHITAAGAPPLMAVRTAHGSTCVAEVETGAEAAAAVEQKTSEPATTAPRIPFEP